jgi:hypothetical protein
MGASKKRGYTVQSNWLINGFRQAVVESCLSDILVDGYLFALFKSLFTPGAIEERFDRALANPTWFSIFLDAKLENFVALVSYHY